MVVGGGFEPPKLARQIYSLIPLATREPHHRERALHPPALSYSIQNSRHKEKAQNLTKNSLHQTKTLSARI